MTAINQYIYHHFVINNKEISEMLEKVAIVEMHHLEMLAELIIKLGDNPIYYSQNNYWDGYYVNYGYNIFDQLNSDLDSELKAIQIYQRQIEIIKDPYIQEILQRIVLDEQVHVVLLLAIKSLNQCT